jgi:isoleucyl-tRNA synthetase
MFDSYGADAMRWFLMASPILRGGDLIVTEQGIRDSVRQVLNPLWSANYFFTLYANADGHEAAWRTDSSHVLDRYVLAKLRDLVDDVTTAMDTYDISGACALVRGFFDVLTNWYIRRSRDRFWSGDHDAFDTLYTVLETTCRLAAPLLPMVTEEIWRGLTGGRSVHLTDWPDADPLPADDELVAAMDRVRDVCSAALSLREAKRLRVRLPLASLTVATPDAKALEAFRDLIADEVNVKQVRLQPDVDAACSTVLTVNPRLLGPRLGADVQHVIRASKSGDWLVDGDHVTAGGVELNADEYDLRLVPTDPERSAPLPGDVGVVVLDTAVTPAFAAEGRARDVVRVVQQARRDAGLDISDRIVLGVDGDQVVLDAVRAHEAFVAGEVLADAVTYGPVGRAGHVVDGTVADGDAVRVCVARA